jgi:hypothetical protein
MYCLRLDRYAFGLNGFRQLLYRVGQRSIRTLVDVERRELSVVALGFGYSAPYLEERA